jgi:hypothetical protein
LVGNYSTSGWTIASDGHGGVDIVDPPATATSSNSSAMSSVTTEQVSGTITFADTASSGPQTVSFMSEGANYLGDFSLDQLATSDNGTSVGFQFSLDGDQISIPSNKALIQSYDVNITDAQNPAANLQQTVSVSIGGSGNDNFVFHPGIGADTIVNFNPQQDTIELDNFANVQTVQQLQSLVTADAHGDAFIDLGHQDSIAFAGTTPAQLQVVLQSAFHLH